MKIFISQPFHGRSESEIMEEREYILNSFRQYFDISHDHPIEVIETYYKPHAPKDAGRLWRLGDSIQLMEQADYVIFSEHAYKTSGCQVEYLVARLYGKRILEFNGRVFW